MPATLVAGIEQKQKQASTLPGMLEKFIHSLSLGAVLFAVWLLLSGHYTTFIIALGMTSCALVVLVTLRMDLGSRNFYPGVSGPEIPFVGQEENEYRTELELVQ